LLTDNRGKDLDSEKAEIKKLMEQLSLEIKHQNGDLPSNITDITNELKQRIDLKVVGQL
jgi:hypothetical protein